MKLLTIKEAAAEIRMSEGWIKKAIREGQLDALHFGRSVRIQPEALAAYVRKIAGTTQSRAEKLRDLATFVCPENQQDTVSDRR